jgi:hypothetical protein
MNFPKHEASLHLTHNDHKGVYETVADSVQFGRHGYEPECWTLQWYPHTPVGFCLMSAADLDVLLEAAREE